MLIRECRHHLPPPTHRARTLLQPEQDASVIDRVVVAQREELEAEIEILNAALEQIAEEARALAGEVLF
jgi:hypothetical protein